MRLSALLACVLAATTSASAQFVRVDSAYTSSFLSTGFYVNAQDSGVDAKDRAVLLLRAGIPSGNNPLYVRRALPNGGTDSSYTVLIDLPRRAEYSGLPTGVLALDGEGIAVVAGTITLFGETMRRPFLARYLEDGSPDPALDTAGVHILPLSFPVEVRGVSVRGARTYVAMARTDGDGAGCVLAALLPSGDLDPSFGEAGLTTAPTGSVTCWPNDVLAMEDGVLLLSRLGTDSTASSVVTAFTDAGLLRTEFGTGGSYDAAIEDGALTLTTLHLWGERIVAGGLFTKNDAAGLALVVLTRDGLLDTSFDGGAGVHYASLPGEPASPRVGLSISEGSLVTTLSVRASYYVFQLAASVFSSEGERIDQGGPDGYYVRTITSDTFRLYAYSAASAGADSRGRVVVGGHQTLSGSSFSGARVDRYLLRFPTHAAGEVTPRLGVIVFPNPTASAAIVALTLAAPADAAVRVVDALGRTVATLADRALGVGTTTLAVDASRLAPGVYAVVAETSAGRTVARFSVVR